MDRDPRRTARRVEQGVEDRPVGDGIAAVAHAFGLAVGRGDRSGIEVIATDDDRGTYPPAADEIVQRQAEAGAIALAEPEDPRGQALERDSFARQLNPAAQPTVVREELERETVGGGDVCRIARQRRPAEWALALTEQRPDVLRDEARDPEGVGDAGLLGLRTDVVAVV